jgi:ribonuclease P protein component
MVWERSDSFGYAILISGKIKGAVVRNRLKRLYREAIRLNRQTLQSPINLAVIVRQPTKEPKFEDINREISEFIDSINGSKG